MQKKYAQYGKKMQKYVQEIYARTMHKICKKKLDMQRAEPICNALNLHNIEKNRKLETAKNMQYMKFMQTMAPKCKKLS